MDKDFKIQLSQYFLTGIPGIDAQHKEIFAMLDGFMNSLKKDKLSNDVMRACIQEMFGILRNHFTTEESLMEMISFPKAEEHKAQHRNFVNMLTGELKILENTDNAKLSRFAQSYRHIAHTHITVFDREYVNYLEKIMMASKKKSNITSLDVQAMAG